MPTLSSVQRSPTNRYQTFPPPKSPVEEYPGSDASSEASDDDTKSSTPLPVKQLLLLAFLSLAEQTALNSISPYLPDMVGSMPGVTPGQEGLYVGLLASAFALAQLSTNFLWGYASDLIGRKPVLLMGTFALMCCFAVFGLCKQYWQIIVVHVAMGLLNGNAACVPTVLGEVTDRSNQSKAFTYLPVIYSLGSITGPAIGGLLVGTMTKDYPYLGPNVLGAALLAISVVVVAIWFEETLEESDSGPWKPEWITRFSNWLTGKGRTQKRNSWSARWPTASNRQQQPLLNSASPSSSDDEEDDAEVNEDPLQPEEHEQPTSWKELMNRTTILILLTYLVFQLANISFNSLYPIFASTDPPIGRDLSPGKIGLSLSLAGVATIVFQAFIFQWLKSRFGNLGTYQGALLGIALCLMLMPWVGYKDGPPLFGIGTGKIWLYIELGVILILKNICSVGGLSSVMLLVCLPHMWTLGYYN